MGRFLRVIPHPNRSATSEEEQLITAVLKRLWPRQERIEWTFDEQGLLRAFSKPVGGKRSKWCCNMLYVGTNGRGEPITDEQAKTRVVAELRKHFPDAVI